MNMFVALGEESHFINNHNGLFLVIMMSSHSDLYI